MRTKLIKTLLFSGILLCVVAWFGSARTSEAVSQEKQELHPLSAKMADSGYVGSDACKDCHEDQFKAFSHTKHADLSTISSWKKKVTDCESCHDPGKAHMEEGDVTMIISF